MRAPSTDSVVLLHGFGGTANAWDGVVRWLAARRDRESVGAPSLRPLAFDLPGHGAAADAPRPITFDGCVAHVLERAPVRFALVGYSMGGRIALHVALAAPERVVALVLVSSTAGIEDAAERARRRASDDRLADELQRGRYEDFIERWRAQPLFAEDSPEVNRLAREDQRRNRPDALAAVLRGVGTGEMQPLWDRLAQLAMPVSVLVGERDERYRQLGRRMVALMPDAALSVVPGGHVLPLERPQAVARAIRALLCGRPVA